jgi:putative thioredoxin
MAGTHELQADFQREVIEASHETPIVVDFWADWCGPCRVLGPVLEKLAAEAQGAWRLVKVDTERHPEIASQYGIRGIPAVKLIINGEVVNEFTGALPEPAVQSWLDDNLPSAGKELLTQARQLVAAGQLEPARVLLEQLLAEDAEAHDARLLLARLYFTSDPAKAEDLARAVPEDHEQHDEREALLELSHLKVLAGLDDEAVAQKIPQSGASKPEVLARYLEGVRAFEASDYETALDAWIEVISRDRKLDDDGARRATIALFKLLGEEHELTQRFRRPFSAALY